LTGIVVVQKYFFILFQLLWHVDDALTTLL